MIKKFTPGEAAHIIQKCEEMGRRITRVEPEAYCDDIDCIICPMKIDPSAVWCASDIIYEMIEENKELQEILYAAGYGNIVERVLNYED